MNLDITNGTVFACLQVVHDACLAEGVQTLNDGGGIDEVSPADHAHKVGVELSDLEAGGAVHLGRTSRRGAGGARLGAARRDNES